MYVYVVYSPMHSPMHPRWTLDETSLVHSLTTPSSAREADAGEGGVRIYAFEVTS